MVPGQSQRRFDGGTMPSAPVEDLSVVSTDRDTGLGLDGAEAEKARLLAELDELRARIAAAREAHRAAAARLDESLAALTAEAKAELEAIDAMHGDALSAIRADAEAEARALLVEAALDPSVPAIQDNKLSEPR